ncbi:hypothetical protein BDV93DRAFT_559324 [Ceratobasidium sp. AG-I]|nr:hypothetical protein BDV93DRAFT_559324 [Ceratobasidium sp. AG-I]
MPRLASLQTKRLKRWLLRLRGIKPPGGQTVVSEHRLPDQRAQQEPVVLQTPLFGGASIELRAISNVNSSASDAPESNSVDEDLSEDASAPCVSLSINDIPKEIFVRILSYNDETNEGPSLPLLASWTCSRWRNLVLHTPTLWSVVRLCSYGTGLAEILLRSERCGLDFVLDSLSAQSITFPRDVSALLAVLQPHLWRAKSLNLVLPDQECVETALAELCGAAPNLHSLELGLPYDTCSGLQSFASGLSPDISTSFGAIACGSAEQLQVLKLRAVAFPWYDLAFSHLTTLCLAAMCTDDTAIIWEHLADSLSQNSLTLEELHLDQCEFQVLDEESANPVIVLPKLKYLHLRLVDPALITVLLSRVPMPNLETLELEFHVDDQCEVFRVLFPNTPTCPEEQPTASLKRVRNLTIQGGAYPADLFCEIVTRMPDLERLMLGGCVATEAVIRVLALPRVAQKLTDMWLELCENYCAFDLQRLVRARCGGVRVHEISPASGKDAGLVM